MKMTKIMAAVMSVVMLLACTAFSASAAAFEDVTATATTDAAGNTTLTVNADGSVDAELITPGEPAVGFGYFLFVITPEQFAEYDYAVLDFGDGTANVHIWAYWSAGADAGRNDGTPFCPNDLLYNNLAVTDYANKRVSLEMSKFEPTDPSASLIVGVYPITTTAGYDVHVNKVFVSDDVNVDTAGGNTETGVESAVAVAAAAVIGAASLMVVSRKK